MRLLLLAATLLISLPVSVLAAEAPPRERLSFNEGWLFSRTDAEWVLGQLDYANAKPWLLASAADFFGPTSPQTARPRGNFGGGFTHVQADFDDRGWRPLTLPHDWGIEGPFKQEYPGDTGKLPWWGVAWYRKHFDLPATDAGRRIVLEIDGAMAHSLVWLNGQFVGGWPYGYSSYQLDLTPYIKPGQPNVLAIRLDNPTESSRWYPGSGLYRNVWLTKTNPVHVAPWGAIVTTPKVTAEAAQVSIQVLTDNDSATNAALSLSTELFALDDTGRKSAALGQPITVTIEPGRQASTTQTLRVPQPRLWSVTHPHRYVAVTSITQDGRLVDRLETPFGIRTAVFDADRGFRLNGEVVPIRGVCNHHDLGALGSAINLRALERQLEILRAMGCNAIRTSHNPPAPELLDLCDRMGFLVMDEAFDCWAKGKNRHDYHVQFPDWHEADLRALVRRDRNHPSVILWSIGNEVIEQWFADGQEGWKLAARLAGIVREEDRTRPVSAGFNGEISGYNGYQHVLDAIGYNYRIKEYARFREINPAIPLFGAETASALSSRGVYFFPISDDKIDPASRADFQVSSYDLYAAPWATPPDVEWRAADAVPGYAGEFVWTGFDYLGEPTPYNADLTNLLNFSDPAEKERQKQLLTELGRIPTPSRSSYFGIIDLAGFPKDRYYFYQARWRPDLPMAHLLPHWTWPERAGEITPIHAYTSGDEAELFLNGRSLGRKQRGPGEYRLRWDDVKYAPGEVKVVAYKQGAVWAEAVQRTAGPAARLKAKADRRELTADGRDLSFVTVRIEDADGVLAPRAENRVAFAVSGPAEIVATDNGDPTSFESFQSKERAAFNGLVLVVVRTQPGTTGPITLTATSPGLAPAEVSLTAK
ncbi:Beta-galactosidase [Lacunisphaera limnophila]|uniref:Beta-galactosidase n=1 Tax=Lacunisphaera limnophila TaxID=1838286 RepID=A0A1D8AXS4_9BACT|nr:beta-galactosidase GalB [Lacunisphaera limnophila]AOS45677.1 Beta-galactosidase [Lacunisphaera limnophila]